MATDAKPAGQPRMRAPVIRIAPGQANVASSWMHILPAWIISGVAHAVILCLFVLFSFIGLSAATPPADITVDTQTAVEDQPENKDLTNPDIGINPEVPLNYNVDRIEDFSVPGPVDPSQAIGIPGAPPDAPMANIPAPPGLGTQGLGKGLESDTPGHAGMVGTTGGSNGLFMAGGFGGRSGATRVKMAMEGGGNALSEAAVANGLVFLARHQESDGHWAMEKFQGAKHDVAATAFGLLPFLGAGETHKPPPADDKKQTHYTKTVEKGLKYLVGKQTREGEFPGGMYAHGLATIAICEAYGLTSDAALKGPAQRAIDFIVKAQDPSSGGWRYTPRAGGDTSVVGWQVMALKSGQMSGLSVPSSTLRGAEKWLDSVMTSDKGGYGYTGPNETPTMTAVGLLCRMYLGWSPKNPGLLNGVARLKKKSNLPGEMHNMYYYYYATQVMHHMGGEDFAMWNPKMRDTLIESQDQGKDPKHADYKGSWDGKLDVHGKVGGRIMQTSLSLLTLEVYYRHLPLYRRDMAVMKDAN